MRDLTAVWGLVVGALSSSACASAPPTTLETTPTAQPKASAVASASAATTAQPVGASEAVSTSPFYPVIELPVAARLFPVEGALVVFADGYPPAKVDAPMGVALGVVENDKLSFPPRLFFETMFAQIVGVTGEWPDKIDLLAIGSTGRTGIAAHYVLGKKGWSGKTGDESFGFAGFATVGSSVLALEAPSMPFPGIEPKIVAVRGTGARSLTRTDKKACAKGAAADQDLSAMQATEVQATAFGGTGAGTIFAIGMRCSGELGVEMWAKGSKKSTVTSLPASVKDAGEATRVASGADDQAWVFLNQILHYDGTAWAIVPGPHLVLGAVGTDGILWAVDDKGAAFKGGVAGFTAVPVPNGATVDDLTVAKDGTVWISAGGALLRTKKAGDGVASVKVASTAPTKKPPKLAPTPGSAKCKSNVVVLYGFTKTTPDNYDFPLSRKALKGHSEFDKTRFVVTKDYGQKFFSALVPSFAEGKKLAAVFEKEVQGSKPQVICAEPEVLRDVKIDLKTGEIAK